ncbi:AI-2E family transporter [Sphingobacterium griseoflavum]|uniref:AI-2E family transporter n=1 Tax=Sphingobacterium griseoflavum TaxID=1474952 RepID=A0ABQ3HWV3_9SPHI|nr:AI-2E family transporter [Sphingobacterium griseoflavum]GHE42465.1 AI-2E family transporter [Sphingobacterium griseoflavum]
MIKFFTLPFYIKLACTLISIIALGYIARIGQTIVVPLILGSLFSLLLVPVCNWLERKLRLHRTLAAVVALILFFGLIGGLFTMLGSQLSMLKDDWPAFEKQIIDGFQLAQVWVHKTFGVAQSEQMEYLTSTVSKSVSQGTAIVGIALLSLSSLLILFVFTFLYAFFILIYRGHIVRFLLLLNRTEHHIIVMDIVKQIQYVVKKYLIGLVLQMAIVAALTFIALSIIGVKYSLMLAIITGVFNVLPYIGIVLAMLIIALITFATSSITHVFFVVVALIVIHLIDSNFVVPKIVGSKVKINSLFAMMAIIVGEMLWGISGMFLAIPILAICKILFDRVRDLKAWGFLLGEEEKNNENFKKLLEELNIFKRNVDR